MTAGEKRDERPDDRAALRRRLVAAGARSAGVLAAGAAPLTALVLLAVVELLATPPVVTTAPLGVRLRGEGVPLTRLLGAAATVQFARAVFGASRGGHGGSGGR